MRVQSLTHRFMVMALMVCGVMATTLAQAIILTFDISGLSNFGDIPAAYGDNVTSITNGSFSYAMGNGFTPNVTVNYATRLMSNGSIEFNHLPHLRWRANPQQEVLCPSSSIGLLISERLVGDDESNRRLHAIGWWTAVRIVPSTGASMGTLHSIVI